MLLPFGSGSAQSSTFPLLKRNAGQDSRDKQPMVIIRLAAHLCAGSVPALSALTFLVKVLKNPFAICDLAELPTHTKSTSILLKIPHQHNAAPLRHAKLFCNALTFSFEQENHRFFCVLIQRFKVPLPLGDYKVGLIKLSQKLF